jgi:uncharacterized delta-60 repeat protein
VPGIQAGPPGLQFAFPSSAGVVTRYSTNGSLDTSLGISGEAASVAVPTAIAVQTNGTCVSTCKIVVAAPIAAIDSVGQGGSSSLGFGLTRFTSLGNVDTTFGRNGGVITTFTTIDRLAANFALVLQKNGDIIVAGTTGQSHFGVSVTQADFALARYTANGALDTTLGSGGRLTARSELTRPEYMLRRYRAMARLLLPAVPWRLNRRSSRRDGGGALSRSIG